MRADPPPAEARPHRRPELPFDGVLCFGAEDWWYHNRGHFDFQLMRELSRRVPVVYINSIGMRFPRLRERSIFLHRLRRKWTSVRRGFVRVRDDFAVYSPLAIPGSLGSRFSRKALGAQTRWVLGHAGFRSPLVWVANPTAWEIIPSLAALAVVYQRTDRFEAFPDVDPARIRSYDRSLKQAADLTVFCASVLFEAERDDCRCACYVDHGVDFDRFARGATAEDPPDLRGIPRPRVGFVGGIDSQTFDPELFRAVVAQLPDLQFVLVGASTLPSELLQAANVHHLGQKDYEEVWRYPGRCDVLIMPWNKSHWIDACNPVKLKEYLSAGRPLVSTPCEERSNYPGLIRVAHDADSFVSEILDALASDQPADAERRRESVRDQTWENKADLVLRTLLAAMQARQSERSSGRAQD